MWLLLLLLRRRCRLLTATAISLRRWEAVLLVLDSRPFEDLHQIVDDFHDDRIWVFAEWVSTERHLAACSRQPCTRRCLHVELSARPLPPAAPPRRSTASSTPRRGWSGRPPTTASCTT